MKIKLITIIGIFLFSAANILAQDGGKAEPNRVKFVKGKSGATLTGTLSNNEQMEYVFGAKAGQKVKLKVTSNPKGNFFSFSVDGNEGIELETEYDSYAEYSFTEPQTGDYLIFVTKNPTEKVPTAKFLLTLKIK
ncbi:MAG: hypothetical protein M3Q33_14975 [Acidobacteriota bacterium]|nr:hypothetical protein [Acidobacteriota bacterium]